MRRGPEHAGGGGVPACSVLLLIALSLGCQPGASAGASCSRSSDCGAPLVCAVGHCRAQCVTSRDCPIGSRCLVDPSTMQNACSLEVVDDCAGGSACTAGFVCTSGQCVNACGSVVRCPDGVCMGDACVPVRDGDAGVVDGGGDASSTRDAWSMPDAWSDPDAFVTSDAFVATDAASSVPDSAFGPDAYLAIDASGVDAYSAPVDSGTPFNSPALVVLAPAMGTLAPALSAGLFVYRVFVPIGASSLNVTLAHDGPAATDATIVADGTTVPTGGTWSIASLPFGTSMHTVVVTAVGGAMATYTITVLRGFAYEHYLKTSVSVPTAQLGGSVAIDGDTMVVGAPFDPTRGMNAGAAYVFVRSAGSWVQQAMLTAASPDIGDQFGTSVAISGDTIVVGAPFEASSTTGVGSTPNNSAAGAGAAYVFLRSGTTWTQQAYVKASNTRTNYYFGSGVAVSGNVMVIGSPGDASNGTGIGGAQSGTSHANSGAVLVFTRSGTMWSQQVYIKASNPDAGDEFGHAVAISGTTFVVGAYGEGSDGTGQASNALPAAGAAYVFVYDGISTWSQQAYLKAALPHMGDDFGGAVALAGDTIVVGAQNERSNARLVGSTLTGSASDTSLMSAGAAYVFFRTGTSWSQQAYLKASNTAASADFGNAVAIVGDTIAIGSYGESSASTGVDGSQTFSPGFNRAGAVYVFERAGSTWSSIEYIKAFNTDPADEFAWSVALGTSLTGILTLVVGAPAEASAATGVDGDGSSANDTATQSGAVYTFDG